MADDLQRTSPAGDENSSPDSEPYHSGVAAGVLGCMTFSIALPLGAVGGCQTAEWCYHHWASPEVRTEPLAILNWCGWGMICGAVGALLLTCAAWALVASVRQRQTS